MKNIKHKTKNKDGFGLIEMIIVCGIIVMTFLVFMRAEVSALRLFRAGQENMEAALLAGEALEAVRSVRDESWVNNIAVLDDTGATRYYPVVQNGKWQLTAAAQPAINGTYTRFVTFAKVFRDSQDKIAASGTADANTRKVTSRVEWGSGKSSSVISYITNFQASLGGAGETKQVSYENAGNESNFSFPSGDGSGDLTQSFLAPASAIKVSRIDLLLRRDAAAAPSDVYAELRENALGNVLGVSSQITGTTISTSSGAWVEFRFQNFVSLGAGKKYTIRLRARPSAADAGSGGSGTLYWTYGSSNPYAGGVASSSVGHFSDPGYGGTLLSNYDFGFKIYSSP
ncbi:MAG: hypothetical protein HY617_04090 [Candidatus Sungbacteria bacterium]|nr:hypothetical protein [Candidatus Sungbacteria bacterium]